MAGWPLVVEEGDGGDAVGGGTLSSSSSRHESTDEEEGEEEEEEEEVGCYIHAIEEEGGFRFIRPNTWLAFDVEGLHT